MLLTGFKGNVRDLEMSSGDDLQSPSERPGDRGSESEGYFGTFEGLL